MKYVILILFLGAVGGGGWYYWKYQQAQVEPAKVATPMATVEKGLIRLEVPTTGRVVSNLDVDIKCKASGVIIKLPFDVSDTVKKDDLLLELDPVDEQRGVAQAQIALDSSQAKLEQAKFNLTIAEQTLKTDQARAQAAIVAADARAKRARIKADRFKETLASLATSKEDYETAETDAVEAAADLDTAKVRLDELKTQETALNIKRQDIKLMESQIDSNKMDLANAQQRLTDTKVMSPMDGVVSVRGVQEGQIMSSGVTNIGGGTTALTLSDLSRMFVLASVDESDIGKVALKQKVQITADSYPDAKFSGEVARISTKGVNVSNVVTFEVKIEVTSKNKARLKPEMTTNLTIVAVEKDDVLKIPAEAISRKKGKRIVMLQKPDGTAEEREIEAGINDGVSTEILSGLNAGDIVQVRKSESESKWRGDPSKNPQFNPTRMLGGGGGGGAPRR